MEVKKSEENGHNGENECNGKPVGDADTKADDLQDPAGVKEGCSDSDLMIRTSTLRNPKYVAYLKYNMLQRASLKYSFVIFRLLTCLT